ncbi:phosphoribosylaminoimidazolesuccinocarboxamide synthase [Candidatus Micrarchaeota archaeon]|nr:phosphoribosylaminoimidazolesuccinocarboxamide synthase [Candidatus Micrarchaeota archaeon]MBI5177319.1 phosphoribosylaminoimidazolesuccinocarboxamide synthase [Candidatus Micrarchaeota archaeon]
MKPVPQTNLGGLALFKRGKVRDVYGLGDSLLFVATDRISVYDVVLPTPIPGKGAILNQLSNFWFGKTGNIVANHVLESDFGKFPEKLRGFPELQGRSVIVRKAEMLPVECVVRGYLTGSGWGDYKRTGEVCGIRLPAGLQESQKLPEPIFTPATKAETGHDENISFARSAEMVGEETASKLRGLSISIYKFAEGYAREKGIIIADTKFEFGLLDGKIVLADEVLTPDSSRFWPASSYAVGRGQDSFDKQFVRDYAVSTGWDKTPPGPELPPYVVEQTRQKYEEAFEKLTGRRMEFK